MKKLILLGMVAVLLFSGCISIQSNSQNNSQINTQTTISDLTSVTFDAESIFYDSGGTEGKPEYFPNVPFFGVDGQFKLNFREGIKSANGNFYVQTGQNQYAFLGNFYCNESAISNCETPHGYPRIYFQGKAPFSYFICIGPKTSGPSILESGELPDLEKPISNLPDGECREYSVAFPNIDFEVKPDPIFINAETISYAGEEFTIKNKGNFSIGMPNFALVDAHGARVDAYFKDGQPIDGDYSIGNKSILGFDRLNDTGLLVIWTANKNAKTEDLRLIMYYGESWESPLWSQIVLVKFE